MPLASAGTTNDRPSNTGASSGGAAWATPGGSHPGVVARASTKVPPVYPSSTRTRGPPPTPAEVTTSANPSPVTSPAATRTPPVNVLSNGAAAIRLAPSPSCTATCGGPPGPIPAITAARPFPSTSPAATLSPVRSPASNAK